MSVGIVVPAYNEEGYVGEVINSIPEYIDRAYVVDDGSTDDTWAEIMRHAQRRNGTYDGPFEKLVVPIRHDENRGVGGAIKTGYQRALEDEIDATAVLGGDAQMDPEELPKYFDPIADGTAEYTKGNRFTNQEDWAAMPRFRFAGNVVLSYLTKIASGYWQSMDSQNGYSAISRSALERTDIDDMYEYYGYCNDLLVRLNTANVTIADVPRSSEFAYSDGWKSHIEYSEYVPRVSVMLLRGFVRRIGRKYLLTEYHPLAAFYVLGTLLAGTSVLGLLGSLVDSDSDGTPNWLLALAAGVFVFLYGTLLDREENRELEVRVETADKHGQETTVSEPESVTTGDTDRASDEEIDGTVPEV